MLTTYTKWQIVLPGWNCTSLYSPKSNFKESKKRQDLHQPWQEPHNSHTTKRLKAGKGFLVTTLPLPRGYDAQWLEWNTLNRIRSGVCRCKAGTVHWRYANKNDITWSCRADQKMANLLECRTCKHTNYLDLASFNDHVRLCVDNFKSTFSRYDMIKLWFVIELITFIIPPRWPHN